MSAATTAWAAYLDAYARFVAEHGRLPSSGAGAGEAERVLARWLVRQRKRAAGRAAGRPLSGEERRLLDATLPGWRDPHMLRWGLHARAVAAYRAATGAWPSKHATDAETARLGRWLHDQRAAAANPERLGRWSAERRAALDRLVPGWDGGAPERGRDGR
jgi:hypothetical protein